MSDNNFELNLGLAVQLARKSLGWSVRALASRAGISPSTISAIETNKRGSTIKTTTKVAHALGISLSTLIELAKRLDEKKLELRALEVEMNKIVTEAMK